MPFDNKMLAALRAMGGTGGSGGGGSGGSEYFENGIIKQEALPEGYPYAGMEIVASPSVGPIVSPDGTSVECNKIPAVGVEVTVLLVKRNDLAYANPENWRDYAETYHCTTYATTFEGFDVVCAGRGSLGSVFGITAPDVDNAPFFIMWHPVYRFALVAATEEKVGILQAEFAASIYSPILPDYLPKATEYTQGAVTADDVKEFIVNTEYLNIVEGQTSLEELYRLAAHPLNTNVFFNQKLYFVYSTVVQGYSSGGNWRTEAILDAIDTNAKQCCRIVAEFAGEIADANVNDTVRIEYPTEFILSSGNKNFRIMVDDNGNLSAADASGK